MTAPAILEWSRNGWRSTLCGLLGLVGIITVILGWVAMLAGTWAGAGGILLGVIVIGVSELAARRFRSVTIRGLRWQRSFATETLDWHTIGLSTRDPVGPTAGDATDRIVVHRPDGTTLEWPEPQKHHACVATLRWWQRAQREFPHGEFRSFPGLRTPGMDAQPHGVHNLAGRWWRSALASVWLALAITALALLMIDDGEGPAVVAWGLAALALAAAAIASIRSAASWVSVEQDDIVQHRAFAGRRIPRSMIVGCYVSARPRLIALSAVGIVGAIVMTVVDGFEEAWDELGHLAVPTLLLRDGSSVQLLALATRSTTRSERLIQRIIR